MQFKSTFDIKIGTALLHQQVVLADIERDDDTGDWYVANVYADPLEVDGKCPQGECWEEVPKDHYLHKVIVRHFETECADDIEEKWSERSVNRSALWLYANSAGRTYP